MVPDLSISIINTNNRAQTLDCLRSVFGNTHQITLEAFVVDNACTDGSADAIAEEFPQVKLIRNEHKLGFSTNNNKALSQMTGRYLCILNDDTIVQPGALDALVKFMDEHPGTGACGPKLLNPDGSNQQAFEKFRSPFEEVVLAPLLFHIRPQKWDVAQVFATDWIGGACMLVRRATANQVGLLDTRFDPLYAEEEDWCYRIKQAGWKIYHVPMARVVHLGGQTTKEMSAAMAVQLARNKLVLYQKHAGAGTVFQYRVWLLVLTWLKMVGTVLFLVAHRESARRRLDIYRQIARMCVSRA